MLTTKFMTPTEMAREVAQKAREKRLTLNLSQKSLSERAGVSLAVIKKFEQSGKISFESLLKIAIVLDSLNAFSQLFKIDPLKPFESLDALLQKKSRQRGRK